MINPDEQLILDRLTRWGNAKHFVRAMLLNSSRANPYAKVDVFSDYDVIFAVTDIYPLWRDMSWLADFGRVLVVYRNPICRDEEYGMEMFAHIVQYEDGTKIDFQIFPTELVAKMVNDPVLPRDLDNGYKILLDKDGLTKGIKPPTYQAYIPSPPREEEYLELIEEFFHECTYIAKHLWRGDLIPAKSMLDSLVKTKHLRKILEWRIEIDLGWSEKLGAHGKGLRDRICPRRWQELEQTYVGAEYQDNFQALFRTIKLFRTVAQEVGENLGFIYPLTLDQRVMVYLTKVRNLPAGSTHFPR